MVRSIRALLVLLIGFSTAGSLRAEVPLGGFIPLVGIGMTNEHKTLDSLDLGSIPFIADPAFSLGAPLLGGHFEVALLDTGAATHIITQEAFNGFDIIGNGLRGTNIQTVGGATGLIDLEINDAAGIYTAGLGDRTAGGSFALNTGVLRGQTSFATLTAPEEWTLPNILGLPMAAQHAVAIRNSDPQIFQFGNRTIRTPQVDFIDLGSGNQQGITRRAPLVLHPGLGFVQGPQFVFNLSLEDISGTGEISVHNNPASPSVIQDGVGNAGGLFVEVDLFHGTKSFQDKEFLFDTGADLTVVSQIMAARLGFDPVLDKPDFLLEVQGSGGVTSGVPGFYLDELNIDTVGGSFTLQHVPIAVLDVTNPTDPGNVIDGILGTHLFVDRDIVIDANPSIGQGGIGPSLFISDPVSETHVLASTQSTANWQSAGTWTSPGVPSLMWKVELANTALADQTVNNVGISTIYQLDVAGDADSRARLHLGASDSLTVYQGTEIRLGGSIELDGGRLDTQFVNIDGGTLAGGGNIFVGAGPVAGAVRNLSGIVDVEGVLEIVGDYTQLAEGTLAFDISSTASDLLTLDRFAFLSGVLEVTLEGGVLGIGNSFTLINAAEGVVGEFDQLLLPAGYQWDVDYLANSVVLEVTGIGDVAGDYNRDGQVDANDLAMWEAAFGKTYNGRDALTWLRNFGAGGDLAASNVPEPTTLCLIALTLACRFAQRRS